MHTPKENKFIQFLKLHTYIIPAILLFQNCSGGFESSTQSTALASSTDTAGTSEVVPGTTLSTRLTPQSTNAVDIPDDSSLVTGRDYYVAPIGMTLSCPADGSFTCPWASIDAAMKSKKLVGGDRLLLMDGDHGTVVLTNAFESPVTIQSLNNKNAHTNSIHFSDTAKNIRIRNLQVWRPESDTSNAFIIRSYGGSSHIILENLDIRSRENAIDYLSWPLERWPVVAALNGIGLSGSFNTVRNNRVMGVVVGISAGPDSLVENNLVDGFCGDGMKGVDRSVFRGNLIKNIVDADPAYHSDGFQSYAADGLIEKLTLENNIILQWTHAQDNPLKGSVQGIGMFDGFYDDLVIRNNLVVTAHANGISVYGTHRAKIVNNTVIQPEGLLTGYPWLKVTAHKDGRPSEDVVVANNLSMTFSFSVSDQYNVIGANNEKVTDVANTFIDFVNFNYHLAKTSPYVDAGVILHAPATDIDYSPRPQGGGVDLGAYEN